LLNAEYRDAAMFSLKSTDTAHSTTSSSTAAITNHWAAVQYVSSRGMSVSSRNYKQSYRSFDLVSNHITLHTKQLRFIVKPRITRFVMD